VLRIREWFKRSAARDDPRVRRWRESWASSEPTAERAIIARLAGELEQIGLPDEEIEIEREMLQALIDRDELSCATRASGGLPRVETGHRVVRGEPCHFSAPATLVEETAQPAGRLLLTSARVIFVGGGTSLAVPWHGVSAAAHADRDLVLVKSGGEVAYRFRCNSYTDALCAAYIGREILAARRAAPPGL
jgi:hypothetical protein